MVVKNMPGGSNTVGSNYVYAAKPDGLTALLSSSGVQQNQLLGLSVVRYDLLKQPLILGACDGFVFYIRSGIVAKPEDIVKAKGVIFGATPGGGSWLFMTAKEFMGIPTERVVASYPGTSECRRAFLAGELNCTNEATGGYLQAIAPLVEKGEVMPLFQSGIFDENGNIAKVSALPQVLTVTELYEKIYGKSPSGNAWEAYKAALTGGISYQKCLFLPPGTPASIVRVYWEASGAMMKDPEFRKDGDLAMGKGTQWSVGEPYQKGFLLSFQNIDSKAINSLKEILRKYDISVE